MKKQLIRKLIVLSLILVLIGAVYIGIIVLGKDKSGNNAREKYDYLIEEISKENELFYSDNKDLLYEGNAVKNNKRVERLKEELYNLILENPDEFKGYIITDEEKAKGLLEK